MWYEEFWISDYDQWLIDNAPMNQHEWFNKKELQEVAQS